MMYRETDICTELICTELTYREICFSVFLAEQNQYTVAWVIFSCQITLFCEEKLHSLVLVFIDSNF